MKFWQNISWAEPDQLPEIAAFAEEAGFYGVVNSDHLFLTRKTESSYPYTKDGKMNHSLDYPYPDVWTSFAAMASVTKTLKFTSSVYLLPLRNPIEVAKQAGTTAIISNNRVSVGFGIGWQKEEFDAMGVDFYTRGKRTDEMIEVMRKLWAGGVVSHSGRFFQFDEIEMRPVPTQPLPMWYGGTSAAAMRRATFLCDGYIAPGNTLEQLPALVAELSRLRRDAGREHLPFEIFTHFLPVDINRGVDDFKRMADLGVTSCSMPPFDAGGADRGRAGGLGRFSPIGEKKRTLERYAVNIISKMA
jgi:probable F420-dependent oxidoreductase